MDTPVIKRQLWLLAIDAVSDRRLWMHGGRTPLWKNAGTSLRGHFGKMQRGALCLEARRVVLRFSGYGARGGPAAFGGINTHAPRAAW